MRDWSTSQLKRTRKYILSVTRDVSHPEIYHHPSQNLRCSPTYCCPRPPSPVDTFTTRKSRIKQNGCARILDLSLPHSKSLRQQKSGTCVLDSTRTIRPCQSHLRDSTERRNGHAQNFEFLSSHLWCIEQCHTSVVYLRPCSIQRIRTGRRIRQKT